VIRMELSKIEVLRNVTNGLCFLHSLSPKKMAHRDLKPKNILIRNGNPVQACITDFGISKEIIDKTLISTEGKMQGTGGWCAPEILQRNKVRNYSTRTQETDSETWLQADVFSLGLIFHYLLNNGNHLFGEEVDEQNVNIRKNRPNWKANKITNIRLVKLISSMLDAKPDRRPNAEKIMKDIVFWSDRRKEKFLMEICDQKDENLIMQFNDLSWKILGNHAITNRSSFKPTVSYETNWSERLDEEMKLFYAQASYDSRNAVDLLKFIKLMVRFYRRSFIIICTNNLSTFSMLRTKNPIILCSIHRNKLKKQIV
jgi:serine/threonine protein kinase